MFEELLKLIKESETVVIHRHSHPDGDAVGSQVGMAEIIKDNFEEKNVYIVGDEPGRYSFVEGSEPDVIGDEVFANALAIVLDSATEELVSDKRFRLAKSSFRIDHHLYCETFTDGEVIDTSFESCCGLVTLFAEESFLYVSKKAASALFTGMVTDSGRFRFDSTTDVTFSLASFLTSCGIDLNEIYTNLYAQTIEDVLLRAEFVRKIKIFEDSPVAYIYNTVSEIEALGLTPAVVSRAFVNCMADIKGIDIWVNFAEDGEGGKVLCELRSSKYNINPVAVKYGGGGHKKASGADVKDLGEAMSMLWDLKELTSV